MEKQKVIVYVDGFNFKITNYEKSRRRNKKRMIPLLFPEKIAIFALQKSTDNEKRNRKMVNGYS
jgi:hypothetical protein